MMCLLNYMPSVLDMYSWLNNMHEDIETWTRYQHRIGKRQQALKTPCSHQMSNEWRMLRAIVWTELRVHPDYLLSRSLHYLQHFHKPPERTHGVLQRKNTPCFK